MAKKKCMTGRCVSKPDSRLYAKAKKERLRLRSVLDALLTVDERRFSSADLMIWTVSDFIDAPPPPASNVCSGRWATMMIAAGAYYDCVAGQVEV